MFPFSKPPNGKRLCGEVAAQPSSPTRKVLGTLIFSLPSKQERGRETRGLGAPNSRIQSMKLLKSKQGEATRLLQEGLSIFSMGARKKRQTSCLGWEDCNSPFTWFNFYQGCYTTETSWLHLDQCKFRKPRWANYNNKVDDNKQRLW